MDPPGTFTSTTESKSSLLTLMSTTLHILIELSSSKSFLEPSVLSQWQGIPESLSWFFLHSLSWSFTLASSTFLSSLSSECWTVQSSKLDWMFPSTSSILLSNLPVTLARASSIFELIPSIMQLDLRNSRVLEGCQPLFWYVTHRWRFISDFIAAVVRSASYRFPCLGALTRILQTHVCIEYITLSLLEIPRKSQNSQGIGCRWHVFGHLLG